MISIKKIRISNFKSIQFMDFLVTNEKTVFVGQNNAGKSNINKAINCVFNPRYIPSEFDFYSGMKEDDVCYIDIMLIPNTDDKFDIDWLMLFGENIVQNEYHQESFSIRTVISQNHTSKRIEINRFPILNWESQEFTDINRRLPKNLSKCISSFYLDSSRDIVDELRIRNSNFSKLMKNSNYNLNELDSSNIERALEIVNRMIRKKLPSISEIEDNLSDISTTIENIDELRIIPIPNKFDDLDKGVEIEVKNSNNNLPISVFGDGTRSWVSILTLSSYIESTRKQLELENLPYFPIVLLEEPESHLHPQAQNKVVSQLDKISAQIFITTHSSNIVSELGIYQLFRVSNDESTQLQTVNKDISQTDRYKIMNFILPFYTEILFSNIVILVEGISDKIIITEYLKMKLQKKPFELGISIVATNSKDSLPLFRQFCELHSIKNIIFADGDARDSVPNALQHKNLSTCNLIFTKELDMECELIKEQLDFCSIAFACMKALPSEYIETLKKEDRLKNEVLTYFKGNKSQYPHYLAMRMDVNFNIRSLDLLISTLRRV